MMETERTNSGRETSLARAGGARTSVVMPTTLGTNRATGKVQFRACRVGRFGAGAAGRDRPGQRCRAAHAVGGAATDRHTRGSPGRRRAAAVLAGTGPRPGPVPRPGPGLLRAAPS